jgi:type IX secretion system PorP/SprF family membrane protein
MKILIQHLRKAGVCLCLILTATLAKAQQPFTYTQYMDNLTPLNSAFSMLQSGGSVNTLVRKQWVGVPGAPTSYLFNADLPIDGINAKAGLIASNDVLAIETLTEVNAFFAKAIRLTQNANLAVSLNAGFRNYVAKYSQVDSSDPVFANDIREIKPNVGFSTMLYTDNYFIGLSVPELNVRDLGTASAQNDDTNFRNHYYFTAGFATKLNDDYKFKYAGVLSYSRGVPVAEDISGILYIRQTLGIGVNYRTDNEVAGILSVNFDNFRLGYSYQFGTTSTNIGGFGNGTNEITLAYRFGKKAGQ